jgi:hypothetical protein
MKKKYLKIIKISVIFNSNMGYCICRRELSPYNPSEIEVFETRGQKEDHYKTEKVLKIEENSHILKETKSLRRDMFYQEQKKEKENIENNNEEFKRRMKKKIFQSVKAPQELIKMRKRLKSKNENSNNESINNDKNSLFHFSGSDFSQSNNGNQSINQKFKRKNLRSITGIDKSNLNKKLINLEKSIPVLTETLIIQQKGNINENYEIIKKIGAGPLGSVYKAKNIYLKNIVAIKMIKKLENNKENDLTIKNQINILKKLNHPNIVKIYAFYCNDKYYQIITEFCKKGELDQYIKKSFSEKQLAIIFYQILSGLVYLHDKKVIHRNIKLKNIMILEKEEDIYSKEEYLWIKIIDFHTGEIFHNNKKKSSLDNSYYTPPEALAHNYSEKSDIWSVGIILYLALTGKIPFDGKTNEEIYYKIKNTSYNDLDPRFMAHSSEVRDLLDKLLQKDVNKRLSAKEALNNEWFKA